MTKLLNLLNEYDSDWGVTDYGALFNNMNEGISGTEELQVISKKFGFIKWLVENEKIDLGKIKKLYRKSNENSIHTYPILYDYSYDESLLMFLAIQDKPIDFLISLLK